MCIFVIHSSHGQVNQIDWHKATRIGKKKHFGVSIGIGTSHFRNINSLWKVGAIDYHDSLKTINAKSVIKLDLSLLGEYTINDLMSLRHTIGILWDGGKNLYELHTSPVEIDLSTISYVFGSSVLLKKKTVFLSAGPRFIYTLAQDESSEGVFPLQKFDIAGEFGLGMDIKPMWVKIGMSLEIRYSAGFVNLIKRQENLFEKTLAKMTRRNLALLINLKQ